MFTYTQEWRYNNQAPVRKEKSYTSISAARNEALKEFIQSNPSFGESLVVFSGNFELGRVTYTSTNSNQLANYLVD